MLIITTTTAANTKELSMNIRECIVTQQDYEDSWQKAARPPPRLSALLNQQSGISCR